MSGVLKSSLENLHSVLKARDSSRNFEASSIIKDVVNFALDIPEKETAFCSSLLFNKETGILKFLGKAVGLKEFESVKTDILRFLTEYINPEMKRCSIVHLKAIKDQSLLMFICDQSVKVRHESLGTLSEVISWEFDSIANELNLEELANKVWSECLKSSRFGATLRGSIYAFVGLLAEKFPVLLRDKAERIPSMFLSFLKQEMEGSKKKPDLLVIAGCFKGFTSYLVQFTQTVPEGSKHASGIYKYIKMCIACKDYSRYDALKAGMKLLQTHCMQWKELITDDAELIYKHLEHWSQHVNRDVKYLAIDTMDAVLLEISSFIASKGKKENEKYKGILRTFMLKFRGILNSSTATSKELSMAVKGYGKLAEACQEFLSAEDMKKIFEDMVKRTEQCFVSFDGLHDDDLYRLPTFLEALVRIMKGLCEISSTCLYPMEKVVVTLLDFYPKLGKNGQELYCRSFTMYIEALSSSPSLLKTSLSNLMYQCIIRTCSHQPFDLQEANDENNNAKEDLRISFKSFLPVWVSLLTQKNYKVKLFGDEEKVLSIKELVYDNIVTSLISILNKLNLTATKKTAADQIKDEKVVEEAEDVSSDPTSDLVPEIQKDFLILVNLVEFCRNLLCNNSTGSFNRWTLMFVENVVTLSTKYPLVSGFYKLLHIACMLLDKNRYFMENSSEDCEHKQVEAYLKLFMKEVLASSQQYKDDLLLSCLQFLLSLPVVVVTKALQKFVPVFKLTLELGLTHFEMAELALSTLEKWNQMIPKEQLNEFLSLVLPSLDDYLKSGLNDGAEQQEDIPLTKVALTKSERKVKQVPIRYLKALVKANKQSLQSPLEKLKLRIIQFLGALGGSSNMAIVHASEDKSLRAAIAWDTEEFLSFSLPFPDMKAQINLDSYLPRIVELATSSSNRQTKVVSCELLHALVLYMIGKSVHDPGIQNRRKSMESLYKNVFPALLKLSCSAEQVAEQLFSPLLFQIIHWMTGNTKYESPETMVLLNVILDGATNPTDSALRDFSAKCVKEFLLWSIKQSSPKQLEKNPGNPKSLFKRLYSLALHPNPFKRLGAAIVFNNIYVIFREEESLVDKFSLELLVTFIKSLSMASHDECSLGTITQGKVALQHLEKIIKKKWKLFLKGSKGRAVPSDFPSSETKDFGIIHINKWLIQRCSLPHVECRHECMRLFAQFLPLQKDVDSVRGWMVKQVESGGYYFTDKFERGGLVKNGVRFYPTLKDFEEKRLIVDSNCIHLWMENTLAALDCYCWVIGNGFLTAEKLFAENEKSRIMKAVRYFIQQVTLNSLSELLQTFEINQNMLPSETENFNKTKCTVIVRVISFLTVTLFDQYWKKHLDTASDVFNEDLFKLVVYCMLKPSLVGFDVLNMTVVQQLPEIIEKFTEGLLKFSSPSIQALYVDACSEVLNEKEFDFFTHLPLDMSHNMEWQKCFSLLQLVHGLMLLNKMKLLERVMPNGSCERLHEALLDNLVNNFIPLQSGKQVSANPTVKRLSKKMLELALAVSPTSEKICKILVDTKQIDNDGRLEKRGSVFYHSFAELFNEHFKENPASFTALIQKGERCKLLIFTIIDGILSLFLKRKSEENKEGCKFGQALLSNIAHLFSWITKDEEDLLLFMLKIATAMLQLLPDAIKEEAFFRSLFKEFQNLSKTKMSVKSQAIEMIPLLLQNCSEKQTRIVCQELRSFITNTFPLSSTDLTVGSTQYVEYVTLLSQLLKAMTKSGNPMFFSVMISVFVRETSHMYERKMEPVLISFVQHLEQKQNVHIVFNHCIEVFKDERNYEDGVRQKVIERLCLSLLEYISCDNIKEFFKRHVKFIMDTLEVKFNKYNEETFQSQLINKICCYKLIGLMYQKLNKEHFTSLTSDILLAFTQNPVNGKELTTTLSRNALAAHKEDMRGEIMLVELRRQYHCAAYNCLVSIISCTQTELKFYTGLLFSDSPAKGFFLFENLVDVSKTYEFDTELNLPLAHKKTLPLLRRNNNGGQDVTQKNKTYRNKASVAYISTQFLMETSLSQDVNRFDFNIPIEAFSHQYSSSPANVSPKDEGINEEENSETPSPLDELPTKHEETTIELDDLNLHESMSTLLSLIRHMKENKVYLPSDTAELPSWMGFLWKKMDAYDTHDNIKLFIARLVINESKIFEPYGKHWIPCITKFILSGKIKGAPLNYFVVDLIVVMLSWCSHVIPEDSEIGRNLASSLLDYVVKYCHHTNRSVLKNNLQVVKTLLEVWKERLEIPYNIIYEHFNSRDVDTKDNATGIQLLGWVLKAGFPLFKAKQGIVSRNDFFAALTRCLSFKYKEIYATSAEVCGLALDYLTKENDGDVALLLQLVEEQLLNHSRTTKDKFVECVYYMKTYFPVIIDKFVSQLLYCLSSMFGALKTQCIECLATRVDEIPDEHQNIYKQIKRKEIDSMLTHKEEETQIASVKLIAGLLKSLSTEQMKETLPQVASIQRSDSVKLRGLTYDVFMWVFDNCRTDPDKEEIVQMSKEVLVLGINDVSTELSLKVLNFWRQENNLPKETIDRLIEVVRALYSNKTEKEYLSYATNLIMQLTSVSPDYTRPLFESGLDAEENFKNYHVNFSWQRQNVAMTPLFVATQRSASSQGKSYMMTQKSSDEYGMLRATQNTFEFAQTMQEAGSLNWMKPSSQVESQSLSGASLTRTSPSSSLLFSSDSFKRYEPMDVTDGTSVQKQSKKPASDILRLKQKFLKDQRSRNMKFAALEKRRQKLKEETLERRKAARDRKVSMYRKYRVGELPDIQIKHSELIVPLQALAQLDSKIARKLFCTIFQSIVSQLPDKLAQGDLVKAHGELEEALENMLKSSTLNDPSFTHAIQDICYTAKQFKLDPNTISMASMASMQQPVGVLLLEKQLLSNVVVTQQTKRRRVESSTVSSSEERQTWLEIAKLYESIDDYDNLRSVYTSHVSKSQRAKDALSAETQNHYDLALKFYREASRESMSDENSPTDEEGEFLDAARMRCYENLSEWTKLKEFTLRSASQCIDGNRFNPSMFWDDDNLQEQLLPHYMKSNMKLLCKGSLGDMDGNFLSFVKDSLKQEHLKDHLESKYCVELALLNISQEDYGAAQHYLNVSSQQFLSEWTVLSSLVSASRQKKLEQLQKICEMNEFIDLVTSEEGKNLDKVRSVLSKWSSRLPDVKASLLVWDDIVLARCSFIRKLKSSFRDNSDFLLKLESEETMNLLNVADVARKHGNYAVANQYLKELKIPALKDESSTDLALRWRFIYGKLNRDKVKMFDKNSESNVKILVSVLDQLEKCRDDSKQKLHWNIERNLIQHDAWDCLGKCIRILEGDRLPDGIRSSLSQVLEFHGKISEDKNEILSTCEEVSVGVLNDVLSLSKSLDTSVHSQRLLHVKALMKMVLFCDERLKEREETDNRTESGNYAMTIVRNLLKAMEYHSDKAKSRFPRLLQLVDEFQGTRDLFTERVKELPCWMFLSWINQIVAIIDKPIQSCVVPILNNIARNYPQALMYPLRVSSEQFKFQKDVDGQKREKYLNELLKTASSPLLDVFSDALFQLTDPPHLLRDILDEMQGYVGNRDQSNVEKCFQKINKFFLGAEGGRRRGSHSNDSSSSSFDHMEIGTLARKFGKNKDLEKEFGKDGKRIIGMNLSDFQKAREKLLKKSKDSFDGNLKDFSPWLSNFQKDRYQNHLEIPGQYNGNSKPMPEYHVKISGFDQAIRVMSSLRRPKCITVRGDNEKEYKFLVKGGEDLRQDQRIQQVFDLMNVVIRNDPTCSKHRTTIKTYKIIPISQRVGIIEWVNNTIVYADVLLESKKDRDKRNEALSKHCNGIRKGSTPRDLNAKDYENFYKKESRTNTIKHFREVVNIIPPDLLRRAFTKMASSSEAYFVLRNRFIQSHSYMCIAHYILGIGDRHLNNTLIDKTTGCVVGIDFGHAFGTATQILGIPELFPFRLTEQMLNLLQPMKDASPYKQYMMGIMQAFRKHSSLLLNIMDVFVHEPLIDWEKFAKKQQRAVEVTDEEISEQTNTWYPKHKIKICRLKLSGVNPAFIMSKELKEGHNGKDALKKFCEVCEGDKSENVRAKLLEKSETDFLSVEEQVDCLVEMATDPNILGRSYHGWSPWV